MIDRGDLERETVHGRLVAVAHHEPVDRDGGRSGGHLFSLGSGAPSVRVGVDETVRHGCLGRPSPQFEGICLNLRRARLIGP